MAGCVTLDRKMLDGAVRVRAANDVLNWEEARTLADVKAREKAEDPMLLAWFDGKTGDHSPKVECCSEEKPGWLVYAESRGGGIVVDINDMQYVFVYRG